MRRSRIKSGSVVALLLALSVHDAEAQDLNCGNPSDQATMNACADRVLRESDARLNRVYWSLTDKVTDEGRDRLRSAERAWISYRDKQCAFETAGMEGGSAYPMLLAACRDELTRTQADRLARQLDCEEGDLSCGGQ